MTNEQRIALILLQVVIILTAFRLGFYLGIRENQIKADGYYYQKDGIMVGKFYLA